jgi:tetratricopeptide (TPR) repeat protein
MPRSETPSREQKRLLALESATAEVARLRQQAQAAGAPGASPELAVALTRLGDLHYLKNDGEQLRAYEEAVAIYRQLASDDARYQTSLGKCLATTGTVLLLLGRCPASVETLREAAQIYRGLPEDQRLSGCPKGYNDTLRMLTQGLRAAGYTGEAVAVAREAVATRRRLTGEAADRHLADWLGLLCTALAADAQLDECLATAREVFAIQVRVGSSDFSVEDTAHDLAWDLASLGRPEALGVVLAAFDARRKQRTPRPLSDRAALWRRQGGCLLAAVLILVMHGFPVRALWHLVDSGAWDRTMQRFGRLPGMKRVDRRRSRYLDARPRDHEQLMCRGPMSFMREKR